MCAFDLTLGGSYGQRNAPANQRITALASGSISRWFRLLYSVICSRFEMPAAVRMAKSW